MFQIKKAFYIKMMYPTWNISIMLTGH